MYSKLQNIILPNPAMYFITLWEKILRHWGLGPFLLAWINFNPTMDK